MTIADGSEPGQNTQPARGRRILASIVAGVGVEEVGRREKISRRQAEKILRDELGRRSIAPVQDFVKLQIARLEFMAFTLSAGIQKGELEALDRMLKILDRLDRYHGFTRATRSAVEPYGEEERERLLNKINGIVARLQSEKPEE